MRSVVERDGVVRASGGAGQKAAPGVGLFDLRCESRGDRCVRLWGKDLASRSRCKDPEREKVSGRGVWPNRGAKDMGLERKPGPTHAGSCRPW